MPHTYSTQKHTYSENKKTASTTPTTFFLNRTNKFSFIVALIGKDWSQCSMLWRIVISLEEKSHRKFNIRAGHLFMGYCKAWLYEEDAKLDSNQEMYESNAIFTKLQSKRGYLLKFIVQYVRIPVSDSSLFYGFSDFTFVLRHSWIKTVISTFVWYWATNFLL